MTNWLTRYPVATLSVVKFLVGGAVAVGWATMPAAPVTDVDTGVAILVYGVLTWVTHSMVTPVLPATPPAPKENP